MQAEMSRADFEVLVRRAGLHLAAAQMTDFYDAWAHVEPMLARIRGQERGREVEPAIMFRAEPQP